MNVYKKLNQARVSLQSMTLKKSGQNKFAGYSYFELGDFLPAVNAIFADVGLCSHISFAADVATLTVVSVDDGSKIEFSCPLAEAQLKGCHPVQNLGASITYTRRYLYTNALEIVEHDPVDIAVSGGNVDSQIDEIAALQDSLTECKTLDELVTAWKQVPKKYQRSLNGVKDTTKKRLQEAAIENS